MDSFLRRLFPELLPISHGFFRTFLDGRAPAGGPKLTKFEIARPATTEVAAEGAKVALPAGSATPFNPFSVPPPYCHRETQRGHVKWVRLS